MNTTICTDEAAALAELTKWLRSFDFWTGFSDDHRAYVAGERGWAKLCRVFFRCPKAEREALWAKMAPKTPSGGVWPMPQERNWQ